MKYFFILGTNPTLSLAELSAIFNQAEITLAQPNVAILETDREIKANFIEIIGGTIKFGLIHEELESGAVKEIIAGAAKMIEPKEGEGKFKFGLSNYGHKVNNKVLGMEFKKHLKQTGVSSRWVVSQEPTLSSVVVEQNKLTTDRGAEIVIIKNNKKLLLGKTLAVQAFKDLSFRDYGRPARDDRSGMLPPKLAQIMINLAGVKPGDVLLDPFCGSGTILTEAMLMGYEKLIGSDISDKAIADTKDNIAWTQKNYELKALDFKLYQADAAQISKKLEANSVDAIITEPYLGPQRGRFDVRQIAKELEQLYSLSLNDFKKILKPSSRLVMVWPIFFDKGKNIFLNPNLNGYQIINPVPTNLQKNAFIKLTERQTMVYGRENQKVWREIVVLGKLS